MFLELLKKRRSIRKYLDKPVDSETIDRLVEAALRAPTSMGKNSWNFVVVTAPDVLQKLSSAKPHGAAFLKNAALGIAVCGDPQITDVWIEDASIASAFIHLAATSLDLGSCWIGAFEEEQVKKLLGIPSPIRVVGLLPLGYPTDSSTVKKNRLPIDDIVKFERW